MSPNDLHGCGPEHKFRATALLRCRAGAHDRRKTNRLCCCRRSPLNSLKVIRGPCTSDSTHLAAVLVAFAPVAHADDDDFQTWQQVIASTKLSEGVTGAFEVQPRFTDELVSVSGSF